jgi:phage terminase large subunit GpA-like protein
MSQWCEEEIVIPNGPFVNERYRHERHPISKLFFAEIDSGRWSRVAGTGPTQNGKTLMCYVIPVLYHLFEIGETVIIGLPSMDMANDKWQEDFLPVIEASKYSELLPTSGEGSRGGQVKRSIKFRNGSVLRFMTAGGGDKARSGFTSRVVAITEADGMDDSSETSREADKIEQIEARTRAFGRTGKRIYLECTVSFETGRIWKEIKSGSDSKILRPCPHCGSYVAPEREHLIGWHEAESSEQAAELTFFSCPACAKPWTEEERSASAELGVIVHAGQTVDKKGKVTGKPPATQTFGFRWSAVDNPFVTAGDIGAEEWIAKRERDRENAEKKMRQFVFALPYEPPDIDLTPLMPEDIEQRTSELKKGIVPADSEAVTVGIDTGKRELHWTAIAHTIGRGSRVIEYGSQPVRSDELGVKRGLVTALAELAEYFAAGWSDLSGRKHTPSQVWVDSGWHEHTDAVYEFCLQISDKMGCSLGTEVYRPSKGYGEGQRRTTRYIEPTTKKRGMVYIGNQFHISRVLRNGKFVGGVMLVHMNSDHWKSELHQRLSVPPEDSLAVTLYESASVTEHADFSEQLTAERQISKYIPNKGDAIIWERVRRKNHWLDSTYSALCAGEAIIQMGIRKESKKQRRTLQEMAAKK